ncbi:MAG: hypothetical protein MI750_11585 [Xanthomonadales bacterium]|nr:hypothetical protein [Xanthomonadales bacterium]
MSVRYRPCRFASLLLSSALVFSAQLQAQSQPSCDAIPAVSTNGATRLGNGTPGSISTAQLQQAIDQGGTIVLDQGPSPTTIAITNTLIVNREVTIDGGGVVTLDGQSQQRLFLLENNNNINYRFQLQNITLENGASPSGSGAAVYKPVGGPWQAVSVALVNTQFRHHRAITTAQDDGGGALYGTGLDQILISHSQFEDNQGSNGGAIYSLGSRQIIITDSEFTNNRATGTQGNPGNGGNGGAIGVDGGERQVQICRSQLINNQANAFGAGFFSVMYDTQSFTGFTDTLFDGNRNPGGFGFAGAAYIQGGPFEIRRSSFIANEANGVGALFLGPSSLGQVINSSFYNNTARAALAGAMAIDGSAQVHLIHNTIAFNQAPGPVAFAGGIQVPAANQVTMSNTILAHNTGGNAFNPWNILNPVQDGGGNLQFPQFRPNGMAETAATNTVLWAEPELSAAAENGGFTPSMALSASSPAIDQGHGAASSPIDQRGEMRVRTADIGAYEFTNDRIFSDGFEA